MSRARLRTVSTLALLLIVALILVLTLTPVGGDVGSCPLGLPCVVAHGLGFAALGVAAALRFATSDAALRSPQRTLVMMVLAIWVLAALDEFAQGAVGRDPALEDWLADMVGALLGLLAGSVALRWLLERPTVEREQPAKRR